MSATIRRTAAADAATIADFNARLAWETEHKRLDPDTLAKGVAAVFADAGRGFYLVAEEAGAVVGQLMITSEWTDWRNGWFWWVQSVYVREDCRRQGLFRRLFEEARQMGIRQGDVVGLRLYVERENGRAQQTYRSLGMEEIPFELYQKMPV